MSKRSARGFFHNDRGPNGVVGKMLEEIKHIAGFTNQKIADEIPDCSPTTISKFYYGNQFPTRSQATAIEELWLRVTKAKKPMKIPSDEKVGKKWDARPQKGNKPETRRRRNRPNPHLHEIPPQPEGYGPPEEEDEDLLFYKQSAEQWETVARLLSQELDEVYRALGRMLLKVPLAEDRLANFHFHDTE